jgi:DNA (cytosine-5)-methyltransferase 1
MTFGSLFSGIGGLDLGFERAGMRCVWQVEKDEYCRKVLAKNWPTIPKHNDVRTFPDGEIETPDCIAGGFPCQDISVAGKRKGLAGERSGLWSEFARIVRVVRPKYVVVENVSGLLVPGEEEPASIGRVLGELAACGYDAEWTSLPAWAFGSTQARWRVFIVAYPHSEGLERRQVFRRDLLEESQAVQRIRDTNHSDIAILRNGFRGLPKRSEREPQYDTQGDGEDHADAQRCLIRQGATENSDESGERRSSSELNRRDSPFTGAGWWGVEPDLVRMVYGIPRRLVRDRIRGLGNCVIPQVAEFVGRCVIKHSEEKQ